jgi:hypothetical protein
LIIIAAPDMSLAHEGHGWRIGAAAAVTEDVSEELIEN